MFIGANKSNLEYKDYHKIYMPKTNTYAKILSDRSLTDHYDSDRRISFTYETKRLMAQTI